MVWHIFKKDWKLLWPLAIAVVALQAIAETLEFKLGLFAENPRLVQLGSLAQILLILAWVFVIALAVFQDAIPGTRQDWLARPVQRRDLLGAKVLFAILFVPAPFFAAALIEGIGHGFGIWATLGSALGATAWLALTFMLVVLAVASLVKGVTQGIIMAVVVLACALLIPFLANLLHGFSVAYPAPVSATGLGWMAALLKSLVLCGGALIVLALQFGGRKTVTARCVAVAAIALWFLAALVPWGPAFAIEKHRSPNPGAGGDVTIAFDPAVRPSPTDISGLKYAPPNSAVNVAIPVRIAGIPSDGALIADRVRLQITRPSGAPVKVSWANAQIATQGDRAAPELLHLWAGVPAAVYRIVRDENVRVEADYSMTLFQLKSSYSIPAVNGDERMPGIGWCETQIGWFGGQVNLSCMNPGAEPSCTSSFLENTDTGERNPPRISCAGNYSPGILESNPMSRASWSLPTYDYTGRTHLPVDATKLAHARVVIRIYMPVDHFSRQLTIPKIRLSDWSRE